MGVLTLQQLALRTITKNINTLESVGDLPYEFCRPFLSKVENPDQLRRIEENSPQIAGEDAELWRAFCRRYVPNYQQYADEPQNPKSWWKFYRYVKKKDQEHNEKLEADLREKMAALNKERAENTASITDKLVDTRSRRGPSRDSIYSRLRKPTGPAAPTRVQLPARLLAERKAAAQRKTGIPDDPATVARLKAQSRANGREYLSGSGVQRTAATTSRIAAPSRLSAQPKPKVTVDVDELFDDIPSEGEPTSPPQSSPKASPPPPQPSLPAGVKVPPPNKVAGNVGAARKRKREVSCFMPSKKR